jgi:hypothetical protein
MLKDHTAKQHIRKEMQGIPYELFLLIHQLLEKRKSEAVVAAQTFCNSVVDHLNLRLVQHPLTLLRSRFRVSHAYQNQKRLDVESKRLESNAKLLSDIAERWIEAIDSFSYSLKVG